MTFFPYLSSQALLQNHSSLDECRYSSTYSTVRNDKKVVGVLVQYFQYYSTTSTVLYQLKGYCSAQY